MKQLKVWVITDTHFNHQKMCEYEDRPENFNELIVANWNRLVGPDDAVIHLGDVIVGQQSEMEAIVRGLNGSKILVRGNHDQESNTYYLRKGFSFVCDTFSMGDVVFSHRPLETFPDGCRFNVHGHFHRKGHRYQEYQEFFKDRDLNRYWPIHIEDTFAPVLLRSLLDEIHSVRK